MPKKAEARRRTADSPSTKFNWRRAISLALDRLHRSGTLSHATVVLVGSYAQAKPSSRSDVDLLVLLEGPRPQVDPPRGIHLQFVDKQRFHERLGRGDDYAIAAVRFGKLLHDGLSVWRVLRQEGVAAPLPDWRLKFDFARRRLRLAQQLLEHHDTDAATEEYLATATQLARGYLLRRGVYPFSRPQLSDQLETIGEMDLSNVLRMLQGPLLGEEDLRRVATHLEEMSGSRAG